MTAQEVQAIRVRGLRGRRVSAYEQAFPGDTAVLLGRSLRRVTRSPDAVTGILVVAYALAMAVYRRKFA
jgi:hypothetical protein